MESSAKMRVRQVTNEDILKYEAMVEKFIRDSCKKNWTEARLNDPDMFLGSSGYSLNDLRQQMRTEICVALQKYNPDYRTKEGRSVKESTFVYQHLTFRVGQLMKRLTRRNTGYGIRHNAVHLILQEGGDESSMLDLDLVAALDAKQDHGAKGKTQVQLWLEKMTKKQRA